MCFLFLHFRGVFYEENEDVLPKFASRQSLPCVRGGGSPKGDSEGLSIPQSASLTAPFTQGSLWHYRAGEQKADCDIVFSVVCHGVPDLAFFCKYDIPREKRAVATMDNCSTK